ncbi:MAG: hypothetical protein ACPGFC_10315, partial [Paracoccaceae bacterium]
GDGFDDIIIGAPYGNAGGTDSGQAYVVYGGADLANLDLGTLTSTQGIKITGDKGGDLAGISVSDAGDVNGDGIDDMLVGARRGDDGGSNAGEGYIVYGGTSLVDVDLTNLTSAQGIVVIGHKSDDILGVSASAAGDVNGDGFDDILLGAPFGDNGGSKAGEAYLIFGGDALVDIDLQTLSPTSFMTIEGDRAGDNLGRSVSGAGDVNGDGFDDMIVGADLGNNGGTDAGEAYVIYGGASLVDIDLTNITAADGYTIQGAAGDDEAGNSVSAAGDVNGDGFDDLIVGAPRNDDAGSNAGAAYVIFGGATPGDIDLSAIPSGAGITILGRAAGDLAGFSVSGAGDINGDGLDDLIIGANESNADGTESGEAYVLYGKTDLADIDLANIDASDGFFIQGDVAGDNAGHSVSGAGDLNGDGKADLVWRETSTG